MTDSSMSSKPPGVVTLIAIYLWIVAAASFLVGIALIIVRNEEQVLVDSGRTSGEILTMGIVELIMALIIVWAALGLRSRSRGARTLVATVAGIRIAVTVFLVAWYHTGGYVVAGAIHVILPLFVLWALYGNDKADAYFEGA